MSATSFYVTGGTLRHDAPSYVEREADRQLFENLLEGEFCYVLTSRQMGKSSLMVRTANKLRERGTRVVILDLTAIGQNLTPEQWYDGLIARMGEQLRLEEELDQFWRTHQQLGPCQRLFNALRSVALPQLETEAGRAAARLGSQEEAPRASLVVFVDEIDVVRSLPFSTDEFFAAIRECYNRRAEESGLNRLTFCLLGVATPSDLIRDTRLTPFNIGRRIELHDFSAGEAAPLARGLRPGAVLSTGHGDTEARQRGNEANAELLLRRVLDWTNGHPYLTQRLCQALVALQPEVESSQHAATLLSPAKVDQLCTELFLSPAARERDDNLLFVRERLLRSEIDLAGLLHCYEQIRRGKPVPDDETSRVVSVLKLSGIAQVTGGHLQVRNRIYFEAFEEEWVRTHMPDAEVRRQRAAFRRGVIRTASIAALLVVCFALLAAYAWTQANKAGMEAVRANLEARRASLESDKARARQREARQALYTADMNLAQSALRLNNVGRARSLLERHRPQAGEPDLRGWEWRYLWQRCQSDALATLTRHTERVCSMSFSGEGRRLAVGHTDGMVQVWEMPERRLLTTLQTNGQFATVCFVPNSELLAATARRGQVLIWNPANRSPVAQFRHTGQVRTFCFSPDGKVLAIFGQNSELALWDVATVHLLNTIKVGQGSGWHWGTAVFSPDGHSLAVGERNGSVRILDWETNRLRQSFKGHNEGITALAFTPDGKFLISASAYADPVLRVWNVATGNLETRLEGHTGWVAGLAVSPDGKRLISVAADQTLRLWDTRLWKEISILRGHSDEIAAMALASDGRSVATGSRDGSVLLWDASRKQISSPRIAFPKKLRAAWLLADGMHAGTLDMLDSISLWDLREMKETPVLSLRGQFVDVTEDGHALLYDGTNVARVVDLTTPSPTERLRFEAGADAGRLAFSPERQWLALGGERSVRILPLTNQAALFELPDHGAHAHPVRFLAGGREILTFDHLHWMRRWDIDRRQLLASVEIPSRVQHEGMSLDGRFLALAFDGGKIIVYRMTNGGEEVASFTHGGLITTIALSRDGAILASGTQKGDVKLWEVASGRELVTLRGHLLGVHSVTFSPDGRRLATGSGGSEALKLWDLATGQEVASLDAEGSLFKEIKFSRDGDTILVGRSNENYWSIWHAPSFEEIATAEKQHPADSTP